jgi:hypothetical protein
MNSRGKLTSLITPLSMQSYFFFGSQGVFDLARVLLTSLTFSTEQGICTATWFGFQLRLNNVVIAFN